MKKIIAVLIMIVFLGGWVSNLSHAQHYVVTPITDDQFDDVTPQVNAPGTIVWSGWDGTDLEIYQFSNLVISQLTDNLTYDGLPQINSNNEVVWEGWDGSDYEIFLYDGLTTPSQLTINSYYDEYPQINSNGFVVWEGYNDLGAEIFLYDTEFTTQLTDDLFDDFAPQLNDSGKVVWEKWEDPGGTDWNIYLYDAGNTYKITEDSTSEYAAQINSNNDILWVSYNWLDREIYLDDGNSTTLISSNVGSPYYGQPRLNDIEDIVWVGENLLIYKFDGLSSVTSQLSINESRNPQLNNNGEVVWQEYDGTDFEIFLFDGSNTIQLTDNFYDDLNPQITANSNIVWQGYDGTDFEIFRAEYCTNTKARVGSQQLTSLSDAYAAVIQGFGDTIKAHAVNFSESITFTEDIILTLSGGYSCDYSLNNGATTVTGSLTISSGTVFIDKIILL